MPKGHACHFTLTRTGKGKQECKKLPEATVRLKEKQQKEMEKEQYTCKRKNEQMEAEKPT